MKVNKENIILSLVFLLSLAFQLFFTLRVPFFSTDRSYFELRHAEHIASNFLPIVYDSLSYGGQTITNTHVWHYMLGIIDVVFPQWIAYKIVPAILASSIVFIVYILANKVTENKFAAVFSALLAAFIPTYLAYTINQISLLSISIPLFLLLLYSLMEIRTKKLLFLIVSVLLILLEPLNLLMFFTFIIFILLAISESLKLRQDEKEAIGLHLVLFILINLIFYKKLYLQEGLTAVWQNFPQELTTSLFQQFDLFATIALIGIIPLTLGFIGFLIAGKKDKKVTLLGAVIMADFILLLLQLIAFEQGVMILAVVFCVTASIAMQRFVNYLTLTKAVKFIPTIIAVLVIVTIASLTYTSAQVSITTINEGVTQAQVDALTWINFNTPENSVVAGNVFEGNMIAYLANRANVADTQFVNAENRLFDLNTIFTTESVIKSTLVVKKYSIDYIYFSESSKRLYNIKELVYTSDQTCFEKVFENEDATIYQTLC
jgi:hypothetical protein